MLVCDLEFDNLAENVYAPAPGVQRGKPVHFGADPKGKNLLYTASRAVIIRNATVRLLGRSRKARNIGAIVSATQAGRCSTLCILNLLTRRILWIAMCTRNTQPMLVWYVDCGAFVELQSVLQNCTASR